jgi:transposase
MSSNYQNFYNKDYQKLLNKYDKKSEEYKQLKYEYQLLQSKFNTKAKQLNIAIQQADNNAAKKYQPLLAQKDKKIEEQNKEIARLKALLNIDGTNSGIPTSQTPISKKKVIPNTRTKSDKKIGGQPGHKKHKLEKFNDEEINDNIDFELKKCPCCGGKLKEVGEICKDELSYRFVPIKRRNHFITYKCNCCKKEVHQNIPNRLKEDNQYGSEIQAVALSLANEGNVSMNKIRRIIRGFSHDEIDMSEGYIAKLQKNASNKLVAFKEELHKKILTLNLLYWDDTVIMINTKRACLRFYGNEKVAYYTAHTQKNEDGIKEDGILNTLSNDVTVMHDHNKINYKYSYQNIECNVHLIRDLEKCKDNTQHEWCDKFKLLVQKIIHDRNELVSNNENIESFNVEYINNFDSQYEDILYNAIEENLTKKETHYDKKEKALINRILEYKDNYFIWMHDFSLPVDDNLSERGLRGAKTKMKVSGQFQNEKTAKYYADIKTYIETCYRNKINPTDALIRLMEDNPYTVDEIFGEKND